MTFASAARVFRAVTTACACLHIAGPAHPAPPLAQDVQRLITTDDLISLRDIDTLAVSPDGRSYALLVRQADVAKNAYRSEWLVGATSGEGALTDVGDGGDARLRQTPDGQRVGVIVGGPVRWSPDSAQVAYPVLREGAVQIWVSDVASGAQRQLTHHAADIQEFTWSEDGKRLIFTVGETRAAIEAREEQARRRGFLLEDFRYFSAIIHNPRAIRPVNPDPTHWVVDSDGRNERLADDAQRQEFERLRHFAWGRNQASGTRMEDLSGAAAPPVVSSTGRPAWLARIDASEPGLALLRVHASREADGSKPIPCQHEACTSRIFPSSGGARTARG